MPTTSFPLEAVTGQLTPLLWAPTCPMEVLWAEYSVKSKLKLPCQPDCVLPTTSHHTPVRAPLPASFPKGH